jgi:PAS domain-containing protein
LIDEQGRVVRWYGVNSDIDDRKCAEDATRSLEQDIRQIVNSIPAMVSTLTPSGKIEFINDQVSAYFGKTLAELTNWAVSDFVHREDLPG